MRTRFVAGTLLMLLLGFGALIWSACSEQPKPQPPRTLNALVGAGKDTVDINAFFPATLKVRSGDTVTWKLNSDELHTVAFTDGKPPQGAAKETLVPDPRPGAGPDEMVPYFAAPIPGGGQGAVMVNPPLAFPTRAPGSGVESFGGGGYVNSGILSKQPPAPGAPVNDTFSLTFTQPGTYTYLCLIHLGGMLGTVEVVPNTVVDVPSQAIFDAQGQKELKPLLSLVDQARGEAKQARKEPGPGNSTIWSVLAGSNEWISGDTRVQLLEFGPKDLTIKSGDTVVWGSAYFHTVTFNPTPPPPDFVVPKPQAQGPPQLTLNPKVGAPAKLTGVFDPAQYYNSGVLGPFSQGFTWSLNFDKPGTYKYFCAVHRDQGMEGTIIVQP